jgi:tRNA dimethylallyltransferase
LGDISAILIAGPTASGKSALALQLAEQVGGAVVNADSMQVYGDLAVLTARPTPEEMARRPHHLYGHVDGAINHSVGAWLGDAKRALSEIAAVGQLPIFVGGTGLYFKAMTQGLADIPPVPAGIRGDVRAWAEGRPVAELHAELAARDPATAARLRPSDPQRILRALEVFAATGRSLASFQSSQQAPLLQPQTWLGFFLAPDRAELYARIDRRFEIMLEQGALAEVEALVRRRLDPLLPVMRAHGVPHLVTHLAGDIDRDEMLRRGKLDTRHYARRQFTFARHQLPEFAWLAPQDAAAAIGRALADGGSRLAFGV